MFLVSSARGTLFIQHHEHVIYFLQTNKAVVRPQPSVCFTLIHHNSQIPGDILVSRPGANSIPDLELSTKARQKNFFVSDFRPSGVI